MTPAFTRLRMALGACAVAIVLAPGAAQQPLGVPVAAVVASAHGLQPIAGALRAFGPAYTATLDAGGLDVAPVLGTTAPTAPRLRIQTMAIRRGERALPVATEVAPSQRGLVAVYARSPGIDERFAVRPEGIEQSFEFRELTGSGDLVVRCQLAGDLVQYGNPEEFGLAFVAPGRGGIVLGGVTGIDANGVRCTGSIRLVGGQLELALPASFVDRAALPLVLDPLIGARQDVVPGSTDDRDPDVAYDANSADFCVVWTRTVSSTQGEVYARFYHQTTGLGPTLFLGTSNVVRRARIANHNAADRFVVIWEAATAVFAASSLTGCAINPGRSLGSSFDVTALSANCTDVDLSGNPGATPADLGGVLVYRQTGVGIQSVAYSVPAGIAAPTFGTQNLLNSDPQVGAPRISKAGNGLRAVVWSYPSWVQVQPVDASGAPWGWGALAAIASPQAVRVDVDGRNNGFVVVHEDQVAVGNRNIVARQFAINSLVTAQTATAVVAGASNDEHQPAIALLGPKFLVAWTRTNSFLDTVVVARSLAPNGCLACGSEHLVTGGQQSEARPAIGSRLSGGIEAPAALIVVASHSTAVPFSGDIAASLFTAYATSVTTPLWGGCGNPVQLATNGPFSIGNGSLSFRLTTSDPQAQLGGFGFGLGGSTIQCGGCTFVDPVASAFVPVVAGAANHALPLPCNAGLIGLAIDAQAAVLGTATNLCPLLPSGSVSAATRYTVVE